MRILTAGESHGAQLTAIIEGFPAGMTVDVDRINHDLKRRQQGYGRGQRMAIESDHVQITSGIRHGKTLGSPITMVIHNRDNANWQSIMNVEGENLHKREVFKPRPGHADLVGGMKTGARDLRNVLERSSARETAIRVAVGSLCAQLLEQLGIQIASKVASIADIQDDATVLANTLWMHPENIGFLKEHLEESDVHVWQKEVEDAMHAAIDEGKRNGYSLGGTIQIGVSGLPAGIGSYMQWDKKLDGLLAQAVMSINAIKGVSFGDGFALGDEPGYRVMDEIIWDEVNGYTRTSNHLGGIEGGMSNGMPIIINAVMKPIPTQYHPLNTVDIRTHEAVAASVERSDVCAVPAASVVAEFVIATTLAQVILEQFDDSNMERLIRDWRMYQSDVRNY